MRLAEGESVVSIAKLPQDETDSTEEITEAETTETKKETEQ